VATVGTILKTRREDLRLTLEDLSVKTKVAAKFLAAIENEQYDLLPPLSYTLGFVKLYAEAVSLDAGAVAAQFKREAGPAKTGRESVDESLPNSDIIKKRLSLWMMLAIVAFILIMSAAYYGWWRGAPRASTPGPNKPAIESAASETAK
jgi:cytoskeletal protein RodZ